MEVVCELVSELRGVSYVQDSGAVVPVGMNDILIVTPYNMQLRMLKNKLGPAARIGTIDKFQGQEAPVVIISMCSSAADASPRGINFLLDKNRLNVAISRAECLAIVVAYPALARPRCTSLRQMNLANLFCRIVREGVPGLPEQNSFAGRHLRNRR